MEQAIDFVAARADGASLARKPERPHEIEWWVWNLARAYMVAIGEPTEEKPKLPLTVDTFIARLVGAEKERDWYIRIERSLREAFNEREAQLAAMTAERDEAAEKAGNAHREYEAHLEQTLSEVKNERDDARAQLAAMTAERDSYHRTTLALCDDINRLATEVTTVQAQLTASEAARGRTRQDAAGEIYEWIYVNGTWIDNKLSPDAAKIARHCFAIAEPGKAGEP